MVADQWWYVQVEGDPVMAELRAKPNPTAQDRYRLFYLYADQLGRKWTLWRRGQTLFNALERENGDWANEIRGTAVDPFFFDTDSPERLNRFDTWLRSKFEEDQL